MECYVNPYAYLYNSRDPLKRVMDQGRRRELSLRLWSTPPEKEIHAECPERPLNSNYFLYEKP